MIDLWSRLNSNTSTIYSYVSYIRILCQWTITAVKSKATIFLVANVKFAYQIELNSIQAPTKFSATFLIFEYYATITVNFVATILSYICWICKSDYILGNQRGGPMATMLGDHAWVRLSGRDKCWLRTMAVVVNVTYLYFWDCKLYSALQKMIERLPIIRWIYRLNLYS